MRSITGGTGGIEVSSSATTPPRVFISYSHKDEAWKERLVSLLEAPTADGGADTATIGAGKRKRLGRSLKDFSPE